MTRFYFVRHGQTEFNLKKLVQGWCDSPLTKLGEKQASDIGQILSSIRFDYIFCSSSNRCITTAKIINSDRNEVIPVEDLKEYNFGQLEGQPTWKLTENRISNFLPTVVLKQGYGDLGGESSFDVYCRIKIFLDSLSSKYPDSDILLVSYWGPILTLFCFSDMNLYNQILSGEVLPPKNGNVSMIEVKDKTYKVKFYNQNFI